MFRQLNMLLSKFAQPPGGYRTSRFLALVYRSTKQKMGGCARWKVKSKAKLEGNVEIEIERDEKSLVTSFCLLATFSLFPCELQTRSRAPVSMIFPNARGFNLSNWILILPSFA